MTTTVDNPPSGYSNDTARITWTFPSTKTVSGLTFSFNHVDASLGPFFSGGRSGSGNLQAQVGYSTTVSWDVTAYYSRTGHSDSTTVDSGSFTTGAEPAPAAPGPVGSVSVTTGASGAIDLSWAAASGAAFYEVYRDGSVLVYSSRSTSFTDSGLTPGSSHSYTIQPVAENTSGVTTGGPVAGPYTATAGTPAVITPGTPVLSGYDAGGGTVALSWNVTASAVSYIATSGAHGSQTVGGTTCNFSIGYSSSDTFTVTAVSTTGTSGPPSNTVTVSTGASGATPPAGDSVGFLIAAG